MEGATTKGKRDQRDGEEVASFSSPITIILDTSWPNTAGGQGQGQESQGKLWGSEQRLVRARRGSGRQNDLHKLSENDWVEYCCYCSFETSSWCVAQTGSHHPTSAA